LVEYVADGKNGFLFEPGNASMLAEKLRAVYELPAGKRREMSLSARRTALEYDSDAVADKLSDRFHADLS